MPAHTSSAALPFVLDDYQSYLSNLSKIVKIQALVKRWLVKRRIEAVNKEFSSLVHSMNPGSNITWSAPTSFSVVMKPTSKTSAPVSTAINSSNKIGNEQSKSKHADIATQCDFENGPVAIADVNVQTNQVASLDAEIQCQRTPLKEKQTAVAEAITQTSTSCCQGCKKQSQSDMDNLAELLNTDFTKWPKVELEKARTELLMELCWTDQAISSRREFLDYARRSQTAIS